MNQGLFGYYCQISGGKHDPELARDAVTGTLGRGMPTYAWCLANPARSPLTGYSFEDIINLKFRHRN